MPYKGSREMSRFRSSTSRALAAGTFTRLSSGGRCSRSNSSRRSRWMKWLRIGRAPIFSERRVCRPARACRPVRLRLRGRLTREAFSLAHRLLSFSSSRRFVTSVRTPRAHRSTCVLRAGMNCPVRAKVKSRQSARARLREKSIDVSRVRLDLRQRRVSQVSRQSPRYGKVDIAATCDAANNAVQTGGSNDRTGPRSRYRPQRPQIDRPGKKFAEIARQILGKEDSN